MKWRRQKFTFIVIPDANNQVIRFQLSAVVLLSALVLSIALATVALSAMFLYRSHTGEVGRLKQELTHVAGKYEKIISDKDQHIGDLQTEVTGLSDQAQSIKHQMADINKLQTQLKQIAGISSSGKPTSVKSQPDANVTVSDYSLDGGGTGGEDLPVPSGAMDSLMSDTRNDFSTIDRLIQEMKPQLEQTKDAMLLRQKWLRTTPTIWPTDSRKVTSLFGIRRDPFTHQARYHAGLDISGDVGNPIYAAADGTVTGTGKDGSRGNYVEVSHGNGLLTRYMHLSKILTTVGTKVSKGDIIAELGSTGRSTGPHLHYEVSVNGGNVDPRPYLQATRKEP
jgi:murein DD-endopeptidase MepM/ murein hydrolase activator NlpD